MRVQALVSHCEQWVGKFSLLLHELASAELVDLYAHFAASTAALRATPRSLDELAQVVTLQKKLDAERPTLAARFEPLNNMFATLEKVQCRITCRPECSRFASRCWVATGWALASVVSM